MFQTCLFHSFKGPKKRERNLTQQQNHQISCCTGCPDIAIKRSVCACRSCRSARMSARRSWRIGPLFYPLVNSHITNWKITMLLMGQLTISMAIFNSFLYVYQRVPVACSDPLTSSIHVKKRDFCQIDVGFSSENRFTSPQTDVVGSGNEESNHFNIL